MGVSGCGKSTLAAGFAQTAGWSFIEGDELHPPANVEKMKAGIPLTDEDRQPFLRAVADRLATSSGGAVASCSALKRVYRDQIRKSAGEVLFVHPVVPRLELTIRLAGRQGHFMPMSLLKSQFATLEAPAPDEWSVTLDGLLPLPQQIEAVKEALWGKHETSRIA